MGCQEHTFAPGLKSAVLAGRPSAVGADGLGVVPGWGIRQGRLSEQETLQGEECKTKVPF